MAVGRRTKELTYDKVPVDVKRIADESMGRGALKSMWPQPQILPDLEGGRWRACGLRAVPLRDRVYS